MSRKPAINKTLFTTISTAILLLTSCMCFGATYYVDATSGKDGNNGLTVSTAWQTIAKVNSSKFAPGDFVLFRKGETWREKLIVPSSGSQGKPITFSTYGSNSNRPAISGTEVVTNWTLVSGNIYQAAHMNTPNVVVIDTKPGLPESNLDSLDQNYEWWASGNKIYLYSSIGDPDMAYKTVEAGARSFCIYLNEQQHITFDGLWVYGANDIISDRGAIDGFDNSGYAKNDLSIKNCEIGPTARNGVRIFGSNGTKFNNIKIYNNYIHHCRAKLTGSPGAPGAYGIKFSGNSAINDVEIFNNKIDHCFHGCRLGNIEGASFFLNQMEGNGTEANIVVGPNARDINIFRNRIKNTPSEAIWIGNKGIYMVNIYYNIFSNLTNFASCTIFSGADSVFFYNNTIFNTNNDAFVIGRGGQVTNIVLKNNIVDNISGNGTNVAYYNLSTFESNNNIWDENKWFYDGDALKGRNFIYWKTTLGHDKQGFYQDPMFQQPINNNFFLMANSPAIDAGIFIGFDRDFYGNKVPVNRNVDIGAVEYSLDVITNPINLRIVSSK